MLTRNGKRIHARVPKHQAHLLDDLRAHRDQVALLLEKRELSALLPNGTRIVRWEPKAAPVFLTHYDKVTNVWVFVLASLRELEAALAGKRWQSGHRGVRELTDRLEQCGLYVEINYPPARLRNG